MATLHCLERSQVVPATLAEVWAFFTNPRNLALLTPPDLHFALACDPPPTVHSGLLIAYRLRPLLGIAAPWVSAITDFVDQRAFVDEQVVGPYRYWRHEHLFTEVPAGVHVQDVVHYALPLGIAGRVAHAMVVRPRLASIFDYRQRALEARFGSPVGLPRG